MSVLDQTGSQGRTACWGSPRWPKGLGRVRGGVSCLDETRRPWQRGFCCPACGPDAPRELHALGLGPPGGGDGGLCGLRGGCEF